MADKLTAAERKSIVDDATKAATEAATKAVAEAMATATEAATKAATEAATASATEAAIKAVADAAAAFEPAQAGAPVTGGEVSGVVKCDVKNEGPKGTSSGFYAADGTEYTLGGGKTDKNVPLTEAQAEMLERTGFKVTPSKG